MSGKGDKYLDEAYSQFQAGEYKKSKEKAEKARKVFEKEGLVARSAEALRVMADAALNMRDMKKASKLYGNLMNMARSKNIAMYQAAASWGFGEIASYQMDYESAAGHFEAGFQAAKNVASNWFIAWNAFGLAKAYRGLGRLDETRPLLEEAQNLFAALNQPTYVSWVERLADEINVDIGAGQPSESRVWLCPVCGSKYSLGMAELLSRGKKVTCEYCGTTVG
ncbi:hypothetical protein EU538_09950 [Candidatus Thorarchaeota archaeon]|nr:MAG: hypothetical protein EU538_09950 [Candidatus Thorarchaeota archaeon]